ncbi:MAG: DUF805 domain-containing protein [Pontixanthobacter sp.]
MFKSIIYNLKHLTDFKGRDGRTTFWHYILFVTVLNILVVTLASAPTFFAIIADVTANAANQTDPAALEVDALEKMIAIGLPETLVKIGLAVATMNIVLLSASFVRRAHDSGLPGMLLFIPVSLQLVWMYFSYSQLDGMDDAIRAAVQAVQTHRAADMQVGMIAQDLIGWLVVIIVAVIGMVKTQPQPNQYGEAPIKL